MRRIGTGGRPAGGDSGGNVEKRMRPFEPTISLDSSSQSAVKHHAPLPWTPDAKRYAAVTMSSGG